MVIQLSTSEMKVLRKLQRNLAGSSDYARVTCILMPGMGNPPSFAASCLGTDVSTVYRYRSAYLHGGTDGLLENRYMGYWGLLDSRRLAALRKKLREYIYTDAKSVAARIKSAFDVEYTTRGADLLNRIGFTYKKTSEVPCGADASRQEAFAGKLSEIPSEMPEDAVVYYADGVQPTVSGRDRVNINGLLNAQTVKASMPNPRKTFTGWLWRDIPKPQASTSTPTMPVITTTKSSRNGWKGRKSGRYSCSHTHRTST